MSKKKAKALRTIGKQNGWADLYEAVKAEAWASDKLTEEEKRLLDEMDTLPDDEWEPITCKGKPVSDTVIENRGDQ